nr:MAG TPA: hypothetical protein [Caudoviricetes sp.]DAX99992.1 MAG TPA: hypothetical protein [Caudoviricetes sp.]
MQIHKIYWTIQLNKYIYRKSKSKITSALFSYTILIKSGKRYSLNSCENMRSENSCRCCEPMKT